MRLFPLFTDSYITSIHIQGEFVRTLLIASEMYLKELVALSLTLPHFRVNILTVNSQLSITGRKFELLKRTHIAKAIKLHL